MSENVTIEVYRDDELNDPETPWTVTTVMSRRWDHYEAEAFLRPSFPGVTFDSESGQFFAYAPTEEEAVRLAEAIEELERRPILPDVNVRIVRTAI